MLEVSIVNYNAGHHLLDCLQSLVACTKKIKMIVSIVDNASVDDSMALAQKKYPQFQYIFNKENVGFGKAHNQVLSKSKADYLLILNPDMIVSVEALTTQLDYLNVHSEVGAITPKIVFENGKVDMTAHRGFPTPWASLLYIFGNDSLYHLTNQNVSVIHEVDAITGAYFLTPRKVLDKVGYFDEDYFMYAEDIDLCFRIKQAGYKIMYDPSVEVLHYKGISSGLKKDTQKKTSATLETKKRSLHWFYKTMIIFYDKHYKNQYPFIINWLVYLGIYLRWWLAKRKLTV